MWIHLWILWNVSKQDFFLLLSSKHTALQCEAISDLIWGVVFCGGDWGSPGHILLPSGCQPHDSVWTQAHTVPHSQHVSPAFCTTGRGPRWEPRCTIEATATSLWSRSWPPVLQEDNSWQPSMCVLAQAEWAPDAYGGSLPNVPSCWLLLLPSYLLWSHSSASWGHISIPSPTMKSGPNNIALCW